MQLGHGQRHEQAVRDGRLERVQGRVARAGIAEHERLRQVRREPGRARPHVDVEVSAGRFQMAVATQALEARTVRGHDAVDVARGVERDRLAGRTLERGRVRSNGRLEDAGGAEVVGLKTALRRAQGHFDRMAARQGQQTQAHGSLARHAHGTLEPHVAEHGRRVASQQGHGRLRQGFETHDRRKQLFAFEHVIGHVRVGGGRQLGLDQQLDAGIVHARALQEALERQRLLVGEGQGRLRAETPAEHDR